MIRRQPRSPRTHTLCPDRQLFRSRWSSVSASRLEMRLLSHRGKAYSFRMNGGCELGLTVIETSTFLFGRKEGRIPPGGLKNGSVKRGFAYDSRRARSAEHTSELQSLMRNSYAAFWMHKKTKI